MSIVIKVLTIPLRSGRLPVFLTCALGWQWQNSRQQRLPPVVYVLDVSLFQTNSAKSSYTIGLTHWLLHDVAIFCRG